MRVFPYFVCGLFAAFTMFSGMTAQAQTADTTETQSVTTNTPSGTSTYTPPKTTTDTPSTRTTYTPPRTTTTPTARTTKTSTTRTADTPKPATDAPAARRATYTPPARTTAPADSKRYSQASGTSTQRTRTTSRTDTERVREVDSEEPSEVYYVTRGGDIQRRLLNTPRRGQIYGSMGVHTADYYRGQLDGVTQDLDDIGFQGTLAWTIDTSQSTGFMSQSTFTLGSRNGFSDASPYGATDEWEVWYKSDNYAGITGLVGRDVIAALTYTAYESPNDVLERYHEVAATMAYTGGNEFSWLNPYVKLAIPTKDRDGEYVELGFIPEKICYRETDRPITVSMPVKFGVGLNDYYGMGEDTAYHGSVGLFAAVPVMMNDAFEWRLKGGTEIIYRESTIVSAGAPEEDANETVARFLAKMEFML